MESTIRNSRSFILTITILFILSLLTACSNDQDGKEQEKKGNGVTQEIAKQGIAAIQGPLDKAQKTAQDLEKYRQEVNRQGDVQADQ